MRVIGIDPGLNGAIATITEMAGDDLHLHIFDIPTIKGKVRGNDLDWETFLDLMHKWYLSTVDMVVMEKPVLARPGEGRGSIGKFGYVCGAIEGIMRSRNADADFHSVSPQKWKAYFGLLKQTKNASREKAIYYFCEHQLFKRKKDDSRAEAALIALYGLKNYKLKE